MTRWGDPRDMNVQYARCATTCMGDRPLGTSLKTFSKKLAEFFFAHNRSLAIYIPDIPTLLFLVHLNMRTFLVSVAVAAHMHGCSSSKETTTTKAPTTTTTTTTTTTLPVTTTSVSVKAASGKADAPNDTLAVSVSDNSVTVETGVDEKGKGGDGGKGARNDKPAEAPTTIKVSKTAV